VGLKLNGTRQLLVYADDMNLLRNNMDTKRENTDTLTDTSKKVGLEVLINAEKSKDILLSRCQNAGQNLDIKRANRLCEYVAQFKYLKRQ
jgi:peroxiredoxin family protein